MMTKKIVAATGQGISPFHYLNSEMNQINLVKSDNPDLTFIKKSKRTKPKKHKK